MWGVVWVRRRGLNALSYALPPEEKPYEVGIRVLVPLGRHNTPYVGLLMETHEEVPSLSLKPIIQKLDSTPLYDPQSMAFFRWMVEYYMATPGDVAHIALPGRVGAIADWRIVWSASAPPILSPKKLYLQLRALSGLTLRQLSRETGRPPKKLLSILRRWTYQNALSLHPIVRTAVKRQPSFIEVSPDYQTPEAFQAAWETLSPDLQSLFLELLQRTLRQDPPLYAHMLRRFGGKLRQILQKGYVRRIPARKYYERLYARSHTDYILTPAQQNALSALRTALRDFPSRPILLHGITASGKTFLYMEVMRDFLRCGAQVLYLLPEIALTKQTLDRLRSVFGEAMELYHSSLTEAERFRLWRAVREDAVDVVVGTRSALFLPFQRLRLIIVDEEHDASFGQEGRAPLYQARDAAIYYAHLRQIPIILGSATPALETYHNARTGKYSYIPLSIKALPTTPPQIHLVDMRMELSEKLSTGVFSSVLRELIELTLSRNEQVILFRNRRGYAPMLLCQSCGHRWECSDCAITLTYHKRSQVLICHYCGHKEKLPRRCGVCGSENLTLSGVGTERIEEQLAQFFPQARVLRMDRDTTSGHRHEELIAKFERGDADILIGTQMVTKGLDFERVTLVGVLYADSLLGRSDFRAEERAYQLLVQLIGRAGRRGAASHVVIQTFRPDISLFHQIQLPYEDFAQRALEQRNRYGYPPFRRLITTNLYHKETHPLETQAEWWQRQLVHLRVGEVLGPVYAEIPRLRGHYHMQLLLKLPPRYAYQAVRVALSQLREAHYKQWGSHSAKVSFHIDP
ncbi:MAG: primosomal protein N' [Bacteroidia bacterium]|nr:primosomal protein N' [Bacteroidia bacterium]